MFNNFSTLFSPSSRTFLCIVIFQKGRIFRNEISKRIQESIERIKIINTIYFSPFPLVHKSHHRCVLLNYSSRSEKKRMKLCDALIATIRTAAPRHGRYIYNDSIRDTMIIRNKSNSNGSTRVNLCHRLLSRSIILASYNNLRIFIILLYARTKIDAYRLLIRLK